MTNLSARKRLVAVLVSLLVCAVGLLHQSSDCWAAPTPAPISKAWELEFKFKDPQRITVKITGQARAETFWYIIYTVKNDTGQDVVFHPDFTLMTDTMEVQEANIGIDPAVFDIIRGQYKPTYPWLEHPTKIIGKVLQGQDNARDSIAVWSDFDPRASGFTVFVGGLSGETTSVRNPLFVPGRPGKLGKKGQQVPRRFVLQKTLIVEYCMPSEPATKSRAEPYRCGRPEIQWTMR